MLTLLLLLCIFFLYSNNAKSSNTSYISLAGQLTNKTQIDILTNNLANNGTSGFIADVPIQQTKIIKNSNKKLYFAPIQDLSLSTQPFSMKKTGRNLDLAISGVGYFKVSVQGQERFTLNGELHISSEGILVNLDGFPFLSQNDQVIFIPEGPEKVLISSKGEISKNKTYIGKIGVFEIDGTNKDANGYIKATSTKIAKDYCLFQEHILGSNVDLTKTLTDILHLRNSLECSSNMLSSSFSMDKAAIETLKMKR